MKKQRSRKNHTERKIGTSSEFDLPKYEYPTSLNRDMKLIRKDPLQIHCKVSNLQCGIS